MDFASLNTAWFALIGVLWTGYFFLEGFDFGVAVVTPLVASDEVERRTCRNSVGPFWDGNEVWLLVAGGATFAAFPVWYAKLFSGFYLALFLILLALIARGVSFEFRTKIDSDRWRRTWDVANFAGSLIPAVVWGVAFTDIVHGVPLQPGGVYRAGLIGLLHPVALVGGVASLLLFSAHGSLFLMLKTSGELRARARRLAVVTLPLALLAVAGVVVWIGTGGPPSAPGALNGLVPLGFVAVAAVALIVAWRLAASDSAGRAFIATGLALIAGTGAAFSKLFPMVLPSSTVLANGLSIDSASSGHETLIVMTVVAAIFTPIVLAYQAWTYWVFAERLRGPSGRTPFGIRKPTSATEQVPVAP